MPRAFLITNKRYNPDAPQPPNGEDNCDDLRQPSRLPSRETSPERSVRTGEYPGAAMASIKGMATGFNGGIPRDADPAHLSPLKPSSPGAPLSQFYNRISVLTHTATTPLPANCSSNQGPHFSLKVGALLSSPAHIPRYIFRTPAPSPSPYSAPPSPLSLPSSPLAVAVKHNYERDILEDDIQDQAQDLSVHNRRQPTAGYTDEGSNSNISNNNNSDYNNSPSNYRHSSSPAPLVNFDGQPEVTALLSSSPSSDNSLSGGDTHICPDCGKRYSTSSNLARHRQTHRSVTDKKARKCPHCDKVYVSMPAYSMHVRTHSQGCQCPYCGKCFSRPWLLQGHIRTHTGEKPFKCPVCAKSFADKSNLRAHIQTHSTTKPYVCQRCGKAFALKSYLYKHEESSCMRVHRTPTSDGGSPQPGGPLIERRSMLI